jgi:hypothetical protein
MERRFLPGTAFSIWGRSPNSIAHYMALSRRLRSLGADTGLALSAFRRDKPFG